MEFFAEPMYVVTATGWPQDQLKPSTPVQAPPGAQLSVWRTDPRDPRHVPPADASGPLFTGATFSMANSGNRTATAPKRSWKINVGGGGNKDTVAGMKRLNLKSMWNDPSQLREALAWRMFGEVGVPASRHTFAKFALNGVYKGLFSVIEEVDKRFLREHFGDQDEGNLYKAYCGDIGCASLEHRELGGSDGGAAYQSHDPEDGTYRLKTNQDDAQLNTYDDLAEFVRVLNGVGLPGGDARFAGDAFRQSLEERFNVHAFLRWASVNVLLGSWDNYFATPANYYLYNSGRRGATSSVASDPYFTFIPWDYDNCLGIDYFGAAWQYTDLLDWPAATIPYWAKQGHSGSSPIPLLTNVFAHHDYAQYYLDHVEFLLDTRFTTAAFDSLIGPDGPGGAGDSGGSGGSGLWHRVSQAAYLESDTPWGPPFTERQFTNDEVYRSGFLQNELHHGESSVLGIHHYVRMRYDSARAQLATLRRSFPAGASGAHFPATLEPVPPAAVTPFLAPSGPPLALVREVQLHDLLPRSHRERWEASGVIAHDGHFFVVFDDARVVGVLADDLTTSGAVVDLPDGLGKGFEDLARDPGSGQLYLLVESVRRRTGRQDQWMARVEEYDPRWQRVAAGWLDFPLPSENKGIEGLTCVMRGGTTYLLGLCEGNWAADGERGRTPGGGLIEVFTRIEGDASGDWSRVATVQLPQDIPFRDYSALAVSGERIAVVSQESAALWVGRLAADDWTIEGDGDLYSMPRDAHDRVVYGNVEGVSWIGPDRVVMVSDRAKGDQDERTHGKQESIHLFDLQTRDRQRWRAMGSASVPGTGPSGAAGGTG